MYLNQSKYIHLRHSQQSKVFVKPTALCHITRQASISAHATARLSTETVKHVAI